MQKTANPASGSTLGGADCEARQLSNPATLPAAKKALHAEPTNLYRHFDAEGVLLYVGVSINAFSRLAQHREHSRWFEKIKRVEFEQFSSRPEALAAERAAIAREKPLHNIRLVREQEIVGQSKNCRTDLVQQIVRFNPIYRISNVASILGVGDAQVRHAIKVGDLSTIDLPTTGATPKRAITGWQLIDYIETLEARAQKKRKAGAR